MHYNAFPGPGSFYKGCLHTHSTRSDGQLSPQEVIAVYRRSGYAFTALTDHNLFNRDSYGAPENFLVLPGMEMQINQFDSAGVCKCHHFVALARGSEGMSHDELMESGVFTAVSDVQAIIDRLAAAGNLVMLCHPVWSNTALPDYGSLKGLFAVEVFNSGCHYEHENGFSHTQWNDMLRTGVRLYAAAVDDAHRLEHMAGGWIQAYARELSVPAILDSLENGRFYASTGPEIHELFIEGNELTVRCSPCQRVFLMSDRIGNAGNRLAVPGGAGTIMEARFTLPAGVRYIRIECVSGENKIAWSQPIWMDETES
ncbi:MAG TPA: hypothetical protein DD640_02335 [Clostridiales bacterium]|nr:hypothetical protein [Clostridiales bacterium]